MRVFPSSAPLALASLLILLGCGPQADEDGFIRHSGTLASGDETLRSGEFADGYSITAQAGQWLEVSMTSATFDPYLILQPPGCETNAGTPCEGQADNDDYDASSSGAYFWLRVDQPGTWQIKATSSQPGESGTYDIAYRVAEAGEAPGVPGVRTLTGGTSLSESGTLTSGDKTLESGEFVDYYSLFGRQGQALIVDLTSTTFDPYLLLTMPDGDQIDNDDWEGDRTRSRIETILPADGLYRVGVTTYQPGESGSYRVQVAGSGTASEPPPPASSDPFTKQ